MSEKTIRSSTLLRMIALLCVAALAVMGCSEETKDKANDLKESGKKDLEDAGGKLAAVTLAETFRTGLKANAAAKEEGLRSMAALEEVQGDIPGSPDISGIEDGNGDGLDDDGKVLVTSNGQSACVTIPETGDNTEVTEGAC